MNPLRFPRKLHLPPLALVSLFAIVLVAVVVGAVTWKAFEARARILDQNRSELKNLAHSLAEHAYQTFQNIDLVLASLADRELYSPPPPPDNINRALRARRQALAQVAELGILDEKGNWKYSSLSKLPTTNEAERSYFTVHQDIEDSAVQISAPIRLRDAGPLRVIVSRRLNHADGSFAGVAIAAIDLNYFALYYRTFDLGKHGGITLMRIDGRLLAHNTTMETGADLSGTDLFKTNLASSPSGTLPILSPLDGLAKSMAYEQCQNYFMLVTAAKADDEVLAQWRADVRSDATFAASFLAIVLLIAGVLSAQFKHRTRIEQQLRDREARYRVLAENAGDVVMQFRQDGTFTYVSPAAERVLGWTEQALLGKSCVGFVHPEDMASVGWTFSELGARMAARTLSYRMRKADHSHVWVETHFRAATSLSDGSQEIVAGLRDVTDRKAMEEELRSLNRKLASLATTDGLTGLANRRAFDQSLRNHESGPEIALLMIDIDHFKLYNDRFGHLKGDECLRIIAGAIGDQVRDGAGFAARYGGEEFAIILPGCDERQAEAVAAAIHAAIRDLAISNPTQGCAFVSLSIGIAHKGSGQSNILEVLQEADLALYQAKRQGRNRTVLGSQLAGVFLETGDAPDTADVRG